MRQGLIEWLKTDAAEPSVTIGDRELPLAIRRHPRARRLTMRLSPDGSEVRITLPRWGRTRDALVFAHARTEWLAKQLSAIPETAPPMANGRVLYRGDQLTIAWDAELPRKPVRQQDQLRLGGPEETVASRIKRWLEDEALRLLAEDLTFYSARAGIQQIPQLRLSRAQRRWGSCSGKGSIRINWRLIQAPDYVRRSVVAHEVAHLTHFDHSPAFHAHLTDLFGDELGQADHWLKRQGRSLYAAFG